MASIARRTLMNLLDCIRCFFLRGIETSAWIPLSFYTDQRYGFSTKGVIEKQTKDWNDIQMQTKTATMLLNITQTIQEMRKTTATVALIAASLTAPVGSILLTAPPSPKTGMDKKVKDEPKCASLPEISCSLIDSTPRYCYFVVNSSSGSNRDVKKSFTHVFGKRRKSSSNTHTEEDSDANNNSFNEDDIPATIEFSSMLLPRQRTFSESSDDNFICFVDDDDDGDEDEIDCKASSGSSKNYGYYSNQYDSETDYSSDESCDEEDEEDEDCVMPTEKKVRFDTKPTVHVMHTWNYAYRSARKGDWENVARDRVRFQTRIQRAAVWIDPILNQEHRQKIYEARFAHAPATEHTEHSLKDSYTLDKPFLN